ncbi:MAG: O-acetylhomoserine aminocarboxypropyltransferase/cysteine synthase [Christensenellaceae bacterium]|nr:O-acetylhomoserine aminocarboxypropyltransferase/cysteine synthase [Christensenellaceae bacterium]
MSKKGFETLQLHGGEYVDPIYGAATMPIYQTTSYIYPSAEHAASVFLRERPGYVYTRIDNPTVDLLEKRLTALEDGKASIAFASGMAAIAATVNALCSPGDEFISASNIYGGTYTLFSARLPQCNNIHCHFVDPDDFEKIESHINEKTKFIYIEVLGNPNINIPDFEKISAIAKKHGLPLVCDNTFSTPYLAQLKKYGVDIIVTSLTKYCGGHGTSIGGAVTDLGTFNWHNNRFKSFTEPDPSNHDLVYAELYAPFASKVRTQILRDMGACISPFNAFLIMQGIETLSLRMERHCENTLKVAEFLEAHPNVAWVNYPALKSNKYHDRALKYLPKGVGAILSFGVKGGLEAGKKFINSLELFSLLANVADAKSLVIHPASTTHGQLNEEELKIANVPPEMIRLSVGLETIDDILNDLDKALNKIN